MDTSHHPDLAAFLGRTIAALEARQMAPRRRRSTGQDKADETLLIRQNLGMFFSPALAVSEVRLLAVASAAAGFALSVDFRRVFAPQ
jgi:hypothetical protein